MKQLFTFALLVLLTCHTGLGQTGILIVLNKSDNTAQLFDAAEYKTLAILPTGIGPHEAAVSPDGRWCVVANYGGRIPGNSLTLVDIQNRKKIADLDLGEFQRPHGIQWLSDGKRVAVTSEASKNVLIVEIPSGKITYSVPTDQDVSHMLVLSPDNGRAFVANIGSGSVTVVDLVGRERVVSVPTGAGAEGIDITPDGLEVWVANRSSNTLSVVETASLKIAATLPCGEFPIRVKIVPDGSIAFVSNARSGDVAVFDVKKRQEVARIKMELDPVNESDRRLFGNQFGDSPVPVGILVTPDGKKAFVANTNADIVTVIDVISRKVIDRIRTGKEPDGMAFSPLK